jgi:hypothetical protein
MKDEMERNILCAIAALRETFPSVIRVRAVFHSGLRNLSFAGTFATDFQNVRTDPSLSSNLDHLHFHAPPRVCPPRPTLALEKPQKWAKSSTLALY